MSKTSGAHRIAATATRLAVAALLFVALAGCGSEKISTPLLPNKPQKKDPGSARVVGIYSFQSGFAVFTLCETGRRYSVSREDSGAELERLYSEQVIEHGEAMLAVLRGHLEIADEVRDRPPRLVLRVLQIESLQPDKSCADIEDLPCEDLRVVEKAPAG